jgi:hypothetical protein
MRRCILEPYHRLHTDSKVEATVDVKLNFQSGILVIALLVSRNEREKRRARKRRVPYSKGQVNRLVDDLVHPWIEQNEWFILLDEAAHGIVEGNMEETIIKFARYRLPGLLRLLLEYLASQEE